MRLTPPIRMTLEKALAYIEDDELVEVTPKSIRLAQEAARSQRPQEGRAAEGSRGGVITSSGGWDERSETHLRTTTAPRCDDNAR